MSHEETTMTKLVKLNERGRRMGETHPRARLTDHEVGLIRELVAELINEGLAPMKAYKAAAEKFDIHASYAKRLVYGERRNQIAVRVYRVRSRRLRT